MSVQEPKHLSPIFLCFLGCISKELDGEWCSCAWSLHPSGMPILKTTGEKRGYLKEGVPFQILVQFLTIPSLWTLCLRSPTSSRLGTNSTLFFLKNSEYPFSCPVSFTCYGHHLIQELTVCLLFHMFFAMSVRLKLKSVS